MITKRGEPSRLHQDKPYNFCAKLEEPGKKLLRQAYDKMRSQVGDTPSHPVLLVELLKVYTEAA